MGGRRLPIAPVTATYRLQLSAEFTFADALRIVPYLARLGVSHIYASPIFRARPGSSHGYDVIDHNEINPELGGRDGFRELIKTVHEHDMGWIQDMVPNHMAYSPENPLLTDLFENGEQSRYRDFFDIDWQTPYQSMEGRLFAPFLGDLYGEVLNRGELSLEYGEYGFGIRYFEMRFPLRVETYRDVLAPRLRELERTMGREHPEMLKLLGVLYTLESLEDDDDLAARVDKVGFVKRMLWELYRSNSDVRSYITRCLGDFNGTPGDPESFTLLNELHWKQVYRLAYWKVASEEINYRRFFSINDLICLRIERQEVFDHAHGLLFELVDEGAVDGLRIDHIDGLYAPGEYLSRLRARLGERPIYVEKILHPEEHLPGHWPVDGTTGYETLNLVNGLFIDVRRAKRIRSLYRSITGVREEFDDALSERKRRFLSSQMGGDLDNLTRYMRRVVGDDRHGIDITAPSLRRALREVMVYLPVYRTYVTDRINREQDVAFLKSALSIARRQLPHHSYELDYVESFLLLSYEEQAAADSERRWGDVVLRFQQFTGPLMAKGLEDTLMYGYLPLVSVNEVGGSPDRIGASTRGFHAAMRDLATRHPRTMTTSSTHDTKRGEDARLRVDAISHLIDEWGRAVRSWRSANKGLRRRVAGSAAPDANDEYLIYQTLVSVVAAETPVHEELARRLREYVIKALREAKRHTDWTNPNESYESATLDYLNGLLDALAGSERSAKHGGRASGAGDAAGHERAASGEAGRTRTGFAESFRDFLSRVDEIVEDSVIALQVIRLTVPGVPDTYRGAELLDLSLVDPDNRRPVDWDARLRLLSREPEPPLAATDGSLDERKLRVMRRMLTLRREEPELFLKGDYVPLSVTGARPESLIAFARVTESTALLVVARRTPRSQDEKDRQGAYLQLPYELSEGRYVDLLTGDHARVEEAMIALDVPLSRAPALLLRGERELRSQ